ncbi:phosphoribosylamine--glycine ligase [Candidatus Poriferisodalis sp.]|uniref:phosphoribosylamine--glycine ligase n=1 Tax=Candidatus Poriferisodalis sp. TaxID=3101277 RepID=UPI003B025045
MRVCVVGHGGREHAFASVLARSADVVVTPGNPGIPGSIDAAPTEIDADLYVIGPEGPLADGLADRLRAAGRLVFGPNAAGAALESSKAWMKAVVSAAGVPTAAYATFANAPTDRRAAHAYLETLSPPYVIKTSGLAAGKGVLVTDDAAAAHSDIDAKLDGSAFGEAGRRIVIEQGMRGPEVSLFAFCDGRRAVLLPTAVRDHKRLGDGDTGPNTGGMGCVSPLADVDRAACAELAALAFEPTLTELSRRGVEYRGVLYAGFMLTSDGPRLLEFNVRFGDPEAQVTLPRIDNDLASLLAGAAAGELAEDVELSDDAMVCVVCAAQGYPAAPRAGDVIAGLDRARQVRGATVFCAGVGVRRSPPAGTEHSPAAASPPASWVTAGGRVLSVCGRGPDVAAARERAYEAVGCLSWPGMTYRTDIAAPPPVTPPATTHSADMSRSTPPCGETRA